MFCQPGLGNFKVEWRDVTHLHRQTLFLFQKIAGIYTGLFKDCSQSAFGHVAGVIGNNGISICLFVIPDFMASGSLAVKGKTKRLETLYDLSISKTG